MVKQNNEHVCHYNDLHILFFLIILAKMGFQLSSLLQCFLLLSLQWNKRLTWAHKEEFDIVLHETFSVEKEILCQIQLVGRNESVLMRVVIDFQK